MLNGTLSIKGEDDRNIFESNLSRGGEKLNWTGLKPVYEGTTDISPPAGVFNITIWDKQDNSWSDSPTAGENFTMQTITNSTTNFAGETYTINITGIPPECDKTSESFTLRIDGDNVTFTDPTPDNTTWHTKAEITAGVIITDYGGGHVNGSSVMHSISEDNGSTWTDWTPVVDLNTDEIILAQDQIFLEDGTDNFIKWSAMDTLGNGPAESDPYQISVDTQNVTFSNPKPLDTDDSPFKTVEVGITISDFISGVNVSTIEYSFSTNDGMTWSSWNQVKDLEDGMSIKVKLNLTFPNGTLNKIKWRASDIAGNGPVESDTFTIIINTWKQEFLPQVILLSPENGSTLINTTVELRWLLRNSGFDNVFYDIILDNIYPPLKIIKENHTDTYSLITDLKDREIYYWTIIPKIGDEKGLCLSGIWSFTVNKSKEVPIVSLIYPLNDAKLNTLTPTLSWNVNFKDQDIVLYDIYLDKNPNPNLKVQNHPSTNYIPTENLENDQTYYWKIVPKVGDLIGLESQIRWFTIDTDYTPAIYFDLILFQDTIEMKPGENKVVKGAVTNMGELNDNINLTLDFEHEKDIEIKINDTNLSYVEAKATAFFYIIINTNKDAQEKELKITLIGTSEKAEEYGLKVKKYTNLTIKIIQEKTTENKNDISKMIITSIILIIIIIVIFIITLFFNIRRKKRLRQKFEDISSINTKGTSSNVFVVKPGTFPPPVFTMDPAGSPSLGTTAQVQPQIGITTLPQVQQQLPPVKGQVGMQYSFQKQIEQPRTDSMTKGIPIAIQTQISSATPTYPIIMQPMLPPAPKQESALAQSQINVQSQISTSAIPIKKEIMVNNITQKQAVEPYDIDKVNANLQTAQVIEIKPSEESVIFHESDGSVWRPTNKGKELSRNKEILEQLTKLGDLKAKGILTESEFQQKKKELIK